MTTKPVLNDEAQLYAAWLEEQERTLRRPRVPQRCRTCGVRVVPGYGCLEHRDGELMDWTNGMVRAFHYIAHVAEVGQDVDAFCEGFDPSMWTGVTPAEMALAALLWKRWAPWREPAMAVTGKLFGRRPS